MQSFWNFIARLLTTDTAFWLIRLICLSRAYRHIYDKNGDLYMGRWWLLKESRWFPWAARLHYIARADAERDLHDHPYDFRSFILHGWYVEEDLYGMEAIRDGGASHAHRAEFFHRITNMNPEGVWTLFLYRHRQDSNPWGFLTPDGKVHWREYLGMDSTDDYPVHRN